MDRRSEFPAAVRRIIAERAGYQCSVMNCGRLTVGPGASQRQVVNVGMAAHIWAASPDGPRGTGGLSVEERSAPENGIWCCYAHGKAIDADSGNVYSAAQLKAWKRLHEARKAAEVSGAPVDSYGLVESIAIDSAPGCLAGRTFELGMRNIITGPNGSGKSILAGLIASVAYPEHVAGLSRYQDIDMEVRWFDPQTRDLVTSGRSGNVTHVLNGRQVPYVVRPYKTILLDYHRSCGSGNLGSLVGLAQVFDLGAVAMKSMLEMLCGSSNLIKDARVSEDRVDWVVDIGGRTVKSIGSRYLARSIRPIILIELAAQHARYHAQVEPTFLLLDEFLAVHDTETQMAALDRLNGAAEHAQVAIISHSPQVVAACSRDWTPTVLEYRSPSGAVDPDCPIDFEVQLTD